MYYKGGGRRGGGFILGERIQAVGWLCKGGRSFLVDADNAASGFTYVMRNDGKTSSLLVLKSSKHNS